MPGVELCVRVYVCICIRTRVRRIFVPARVNVDGIPGKRNSIRILRCMYKFAIIRHVYELQRASFRRRKHFKADLKCPGKGRIMRKVVSLQSSP